MKIDDLELAKKALCRCRAFKAECLVPVVGEEDAIAACWVCAHDYLEHDRPLGTAPGLPCDCSREQIYPARVIAERDRAASAIAPA